MQDILQDYRDALTFWNEAYTLREEKKERYHQLTPESNADVLAASKKLASIIRDELKNQNRVLDYGCGEGWAGMLLCQAGCRDVTCAEMAENAIALVKTVQQKLQIGHELHPVVIDENWLSALPDRCFDGIVCSNVLDVIPTSVCESILSQFARILQKGGKLVIGLNYHADLKDVPEKGITIRHGNCLYINDTLRLVSRSDEEWTELFSRYFTVEKLTHFGWNKEETERRRCYVLLPKC